MRSLSNADYTKCMIRCILPPPRSPILISIVEKCLLSNWPRRLCVGTRYLGALSSSSTPFSHLTGLNSGGCKNSSTFVIPVIENRMFAGWRSALAIRKLITPPEFRHTTMDETWQVKKVKAQQKLDGCSRKGYSLLVLYTLPRTRYSGAVSQWPKKRKIPILHHRIEYAHSHQMCENMDLYLIIGKTSYSTT